MRQQANLAHPEHGQLGHHLGPARPARRLPLWPLLAVVVLYGLTFAVGYMASNDAEQRFAALGEAAWTKSAPE